MTKREEKETGMNRATQTGPRLFWEPTIPLWREVPQYLLGGQTVTVCLSPLFLLTENAARQDV